jgi:thymidylate kinase
LIVEGYWGVGKTTLVKAIQNLSPWATLFIKEPNLLKKKIKSEIDVWYRKQHDRNWKCAVDKTKKGTLVILERSVLSSIAFYYAANGHLPRWAYKAVRTMKLIRTDFKLVFLYGAVAFLKTHMETVLDRTVIDAMREKPDFISNYIRFYRHILPEQFAIMPLFIRVDKNGVFRKKCEIRFDFIRFFRREYHPPIK